MIYVIAELKLESYDEWKPLFNERSAMRKEHGAEEARLFRDMDDSHKVVILFKWDTKENAKNYMDSEALQKSLSNVGAEIEKISYLNEMEKTI